jgi:outer membrane protein assembly factor BamB
MNRWILLFIVLLFFLGCAQPGNQLEDSNWPMFRRDLQHTGVNNVKAVRQEQICELKWKFQTMAGVLSSPAVADGMVYFGSKDGHLYAVDIKTGRLHWKFETERGNWVVSSPTVADGIVFFGSNDDHLYAADTRTGKEMWKFEARDEVYSSPAIHNGVVYIGTIYALDFKTGKEKWQFQAGREIFSSPAIDGSTVYFGGEHDDLYALDIEAGEKKWKFETKGDVQSSPAVYDDVVYFGSNDGNLYAVDTKTGNEKWRFKTGARVFSSPAAADGMVYFGSKDQHLYAVDINTGKEEWRFKTHGEVLSSPAISTGTAFFGSKDGNLYAVEMKTGREKWRFKTGGEIFSSPAVVDGVVYFGSEDGNLYAVRFIDQKKQVKAGNGKLFPIKQYGKWGYINKKGDIVIEPQFDEADTFSEGSAPVRIGGKWGYINQTGIVVINPIYDEAGGFFEGLAAVKIDDYWGYINQRGGYVIKPKYDEGGAFYEGLAAVKIGSKYGYIDKRGRMLIHPQFDKAAGFSEGIAGVEIENMVCYINGKGKFVWKPTVDINAKSPFPKTHDKDILWVRTYGSSDKSEWPYIVQQTSDDGYIIAGAVDYISRNTTYSGGSMFLIKTGSQGKQQWSRTFHRSCFIHARSLQQTDDGGCIIACNISPYPHARGSNPSGVDGLLIKTDNAGNLQWERTLGEPPDLERIDCVQQSSDGGYIIAGNTLSNKPYFAGAGRHDLWLIKLDAQGESQWKRSFDRSNQYRRISFVRQTSGGGYAFAYRVSKEKRVVCLINTDMHGRIQSIRQFNEFPGNYVIKSLSQTFDGGLLLFGPVFDKNGYYDLLIKIDAQCKKQWETSLSRGKDTILYSRHQQTSDGGFILAQSIKSIKTDYDIHLIKTGEKGKKQWERTLGIPGNQSVRLRAIQQTLDGGFIIAGQTSFSGDNSDILLIKIKEKSGEYKSIPGEKDSMEDRGRFKKHSGKREIQLFDDFSSDIGWRDETSGDFTIRDGQLNWNAKRSKVQKMYIPIEEYSGNFQVNFDFQLAHRQNNVWLEVGLAESLTGAQNDPVNDPIGTFIKFGWIGGGTPYSVYYVIPLARYYNPRD